MLQIHSLEPGDSSCYRVIAELVGPGDGYRQGVFFAFGIGSSGQMGAFIFNAEGSPDYAYFEEKMGRAIGSNLHARRVAYLVLRYLLGLGATPFMPWELDHDPTKRFHPDWTAQLPPPLLQNQPA